MYVYMYLGNQPKDLKFFFFIMITLSFQLTLKLPPQDSKEQQVPKSQRFISTRSSRFTTNLQYITVCSF